eukprot:TRINITY_DN47948_c0_g1_i1.p1 TRINITY_DN47948_c0_g1~~TRINITY_DN47948_c0_g1_i1.p1  ORF type:complete len:473 (+),score=64.24 TRINITY_DN47948_c0_g1_i1:41-1459(+)
MMAADILGRKEAVLILLILASDTSGLPIEGVPQSFLGALDLDDVCSAVEYGGSCCDSFLQSHGQILQHNLSLHVTNDSDSLGNCRKYGCSIEYVQSNTCQCNIGCSAHGNCCNDFTAVCSSGHSIQQTTPTAKHSCRASHPQGLHVVQLLDIGRQFVLAMPQQMVKSPSGVPLVMHFHGFTDSPWYSNRMTGISKIADRFGWIAVMPFALNTRQSNGLSGVRACCPTDCDEACCKQGLKLNKMDDLACGWFPATFEKDMVLTVAAVQWTKREACVDTDKVFATGFSSGGIFVNHLACAAAHIFRGVAPMSGDFAFEPCSPSRPISYVSVCGSMDDGAFCQFGQAHTAQRFSKLYNCSGTGPHDGPVRMRLSATTTCKLWDSCEGNNFVEYCRIEGLSHDVSGHLRPDDTSFLRPGADLDFPRYAMQKFSLLTNGSILFFGHPTKEELVHKASSWPPPRRSDYVHEFRHPPVM